MSFDIQRLVEFDFLRATEIAALNSMQWVGKGDKESADAAACDAIRGMMDIPAFYLTKLAYPSKVRKAWIADGDIATALAPALGSTNIDLYAGIGGTPEGVLAAAGL